MQASTFTATGRRGQIVAAAIEVIAELGATRASFGRIAKRAGLSSTGMISYHFAGRDDLLAACVAEIEQVTSAFMAPRIHAAHGHVARLRAYVEANVALVAEHPAAVRALIDLLTTAGTPSSAVDQRLELFENHFRHGQAAGAFRPFNTHAVAVALIGGLDAAIARASAAELAPDELAELGRELADLFVRATVSDPSPADTPREAHP